MDRDGSALSGCHLSDSRGNVVSQPVATFFVTHQVYGDDAGEHSRRLTRDRRLGCCRSAGCAMPTRRSTVLHVGLRRQKRQNIAVEFVRALDVREMPRIGIEQESRAMDALRQQAAVLRIHPRIERAMHDQRRSVNVP